MKNMHCIHGIQDAQRLALFLIFILPVNAVCFLSSFVQSSFP